MFRIPPFDRGLKPPQRAEEQNTAMLAFQKELDSMREDAQRGREREARRAREDEDELQILRERCERLEEEHTSGAGGVRHATFRKPLTYPDSMIGR